MIGKPTQVERQNATTLSGTILKLPLRIEDSSTCDIILNTTIWLHISKAEYEPSSDPNFINMCFVAVFPFGQFHATITKANVKKVFKDQAISKIDPADAVAVFRDLFHLDLESILESGEKEGVHHDLFVNAKISTSKDDFDEFGEYSGDRMENETLSILVKRLGKFNPTIGQFEMQPVSLANVDYLANEGDLFNWMELYHHQVEELTNSLVLSKQNYSKISEDNELLKNGLRIARDDFQNIVDDLESKFYQALNAKKNMIYHLTHSDGAKIKELVGLNREYILNTGKLRNIDTDALKSGENFDDKSLSKKRISATTNPIDEYTSRKRQKVKAENSSDENTKFAAKMDEEEEKMEEMEEMEDSCHAFNTKVKREPEFAKALSKYCLENPNDSFDKNVEVKHENELLSVSCDSDMAETKKKLPSIELKDDSWSLSVPKNSLNEESDKEVLKRAMQYEFENDEDEDDKEEEEEEEESELVGQTTEDDTGRESDDNYVKVDDVLETNSEKESSGSGKIKDEKSNHKKQVTSPGGDNHCSSETLVIEDSLSAAKDNNNIIKIINEKHHVDENRDKDVQGRLIKSTQDLTDYSSSSEGAVDEKTQIYKTSSNIPDTAEVEDDTDYSDDSNADDDDNDDNDDDV